MSKKYQIVPSNSKTLFLRNLEDVLLSHEMIFDSKIREFRNHPCIQILSLVDDYLSDVNNNTNELMMNQYISDCLVDRFMFDRSVLSNCKKS